MGEVHLFPISIRLSSNSPFSHRSLSAMRFPEELWLAPLERQLVADLVCSFHRVPLALTDRLANLVYLNEPAEVLFGERAEALVNRTTLSILGLDKGAPPPEGLIEALLGSGDPWRGLVARRREGGGTVEVISSGAAPLPAEFLSVDASAILLNRAFVCGVLQYSPLRPTIACTHHGGQT